MNKTHTLVLYALACILLTTTLYSLFLIRDLEDERGVWVCSNVVCTRTISSAEWADNNCFTAPTENGSEIIVCRVVVDGANQLIPFSALNISGIEQCVEYACDQEVNVRVANYTLNITPLS